MGECQKQDHNAHHSNLVLQGTQGEEQHHKICMLTRCETELGIFKTILCHEDLSSLVLSCI